jgi:hypothetical protein
MMPNSVVTGNCTVCSGGGGGASATQFLTSYTTLLAPDNASLTGGSIALLASYDQSITNTPAPCLDTLGRSVAFGFENTMTRIRVANGPPNRTLAFVQDIATGSAIGPVNEHFTTHMMVSTTTSCGDLQPVMVGWRNNPQLEIQGVSMGPANDGIYGGENDAGNTTIMTTVGAFTIRPGTGNNIPGGAAVWIDFGSQETANIQVTHSGSPQGTWFRLQRVSQSQIIFYFRDPIAGTDVITITPG